MSKLQHRSVVYILALGLLYFIFLVYLLAFCIPVWLGFNISNQHVLFGLWALCAGSSEGGDLSDCRKNAFRDDGFPDFDWYDGVRGLWVAGVFFYVVAVLYSFVENCCASEKSRDYGLTGALAILAGLCGAVGVIVVAIKVEVDYKTTFQYQWGYMLACITSGLTIILAIVILITRNIKSNEKSRDDRTADYVFAHKQGNPYVSEYTNQGYSRDDIPLANGVTYHHTPTAHPYTMYQDNYNGNIPPARTQPDVYGQPVKNPYGYYNGRPIHQRDPADASTVYTDLSNGYTNELINAEHTLSRSNVGQRGDFARGGGDYAKQDFAGRNDYFLNGSRAY